MASEIHDIYRRLCEDDRFAEVNAALRRGVVDDTLIYEIALSEFESEPNTRAAAADFAGKHDLDVVDAGSGLLLLRPRS